MGTFEPVHLQPMGMPSILMASRRRPTNQADPQHRSVYACNAFHVTTASNSKEGRRFWRAKLLGMHWSRIAADAAVGSMCACKVKATVVLYVVALTRQARAFNKRRHTERQAFVFPLAHLIPRTTATTRRRKSCRRHADQNMCCRS